MGNERRETIAYRATAITLRLHLHISLGGVGVGETLFLSVVDEVFSYRPMIRKFVLCTRNSAYANFIYTGTCARARALVFMFIRER